MKLINICLFSLLPLITFASEPFQGSYTMVISQDRETVPIKIQTKDNHIRMEMEANGMNAIMVLRDGMDSMMMIMPQQRMYMVMDLPKFQQEAKADSPEDEEFPFKKTGETKEILGYTAHEFINESGNDKTVVWATEELGTMPLMRNPMMEDVTRAMREVSGLSAFFPLEMTNYENGKKQVDLKITEIEKKSLEDSLFEAPAGFMKMNMPAGMGGMMGR